MLGREGSVVLETSVGGRHTLCPFVSLVLGWRALFLFLSCSSFFSAFLRFFFLIASLGPADNEHDVLWHYVSEEKPTVCLECGQFFKMERVHHTEQFVDPNEHH